MAGQHTRPFTEWLPFALYGPPPPWGLPPAAAFTPSSFPARQGTEPTGHAQKAHAPLSSPS